MDFLKNNARFSFIHEGKNGFELKHTKNITENGNEIISEYIFENGLKITNIAKFYEKYNAYEWVNWLENTGKESTGLISGLWDCDCEVALKKASPCLPTPYLPNTDTTTKVYAPVGSTWSAEEFFSDVHRIENSSYKNFMFLNEQKEYKAEQGRSSGGENAPFFNVHQDGLGVVWAVGWTGQWKAKITRNEDTVRLQSGVEDAEFVLYPGEKIRTSSVVLMKYEGDFEFAQNKWRRLVKDEFTLIGKRVENAPLCAGIWGGMKSDEVIKRIDRISEKKIPVEYIWMDAGWYGYGTQPTWNEFEGDWYEKTGDWVISRDIHPEEMKDVVAKIKENGLKFLLWFEPERSTLKSKMFSQHPEYFLVCDEGDVALLNLGNPEAFDYCVRTVSDLIERLGISCYRQDFNMLPTYQWRANDKPRRRGILEIKHIMGLYKFWDTLLERFPNLIIDNCASGGRRIDIETLRRSVPLWRSDAQCPADPIIEMTQAHNMNFAQWMPYSGTGCGRIPETYRMRSSYAGGMTTNFTFDAKDNFIYDDKFCKWFKGICEEYLKVRPYFAGDIYHLTRPDTDETAWAAVQWDRPEESDGMLQVFRREMSPYSEAVFNLKNMSLDANYSFTDLAGGECTLSGKDIYEKGFTVKIPEAKTSKIYIYRKN